MLNALKEVAGVILVGAFWMLGFWVSGLQPHWMLAVSWIVLSLILYGVAAIAGRIALKRRAKSWQTPTHSS